MLNFCHRDPGSLLQGKAVDSCADRRKSQTADSLLLGQG